MSLENLLASELIGMFTLPHHTLSVVSKSYTTLLSVGDLPVLKPE